MATPTPGRPSSARTASSIPAADGPSAGPSPVTDEARAAALWVFIQSKAPRFTFGDALNAVKALNIGPFDNDQTLARRLCQALKQRRVSMKYVNALHAVARMHGRNSWHTAGSRQAGRLRFETYDRDITDLHATSHQTWTELADALRVWADRLYASGRMPLRVLTMSFESDTLTFYVPVAAQNEDTTTHRNVMWPVGVVVPVSSDDQSWLSEAPAALEKLRRHLEETGMAVLDGYAALSLCAKSWRDDASASFDDVMNSELVLVRMDSDSGLQGYEVARGDELTCWHQLELSMRADHQVDEPVALDISVPDKGEGAWYVNGVRHLWSLETITPSGFTPSRAARPLASQDCERLLRRYKLAKRIHVNGFSHHDVTKNGRYAKRPEQEWHINVQRLSNLLAKEGLTWESYLERFAAQPIPLESVLPVEHVMKLVSDLQVQEPNRLFAWPRMSEMTLVQDARLLCSLMPRVEAVRYAKPAELTPDLAQELHNAVDQFSNAVQLQRLVATGVLPMTQELPYLVYTNDAQEMCEDIKRLGLRMYVAVAPNLTRRAQPAEGLPLYQLQAQPWTLGHALLLRFEDARAEQ